MQPAHKIGLRGFFYAAVCPSNKLTREPSIWLTTLTGEDVKLSGFGNFTLREKRAWPGRNPKTGKPVEIAARRVVTFHAGPKLRKRC